MNQIKLKCEECGGTLTINEGQSVMQCPFCGSQQLLVESDEVKIETIRSNTQRDIEFERIHSTNAAQLEAQRQAHQIEVEDHKRFTKMVVITKLIGAGLILLSVIIFVVLINSGSSDGGVVLIFLALIIIMLVSGIVLLCKRHKRK